MPIAFIIVGIDHSIAPAWLVERMRERDAEMRVAAAGLVGQAGTNEVFYASLPGTTEIFVCSSDPVAASGIVVDIVTKTAGLRAEDWGAFHRFVDEPALAHLLSVLTGPDGDRAAAQLKWYWEQSQRSGATSHILRDISEYVRASVRAGEHVPGSPETSRAAARRLWLQLQAQASLPEGTRIRHEVDAICAEEIATFRRSCGGLMTADQEKAVKIVTARISERVGEWITRVRRDPRTGTAPGIRESS